MARKVDTRPTSSTTRPRGGGLRVTRWVLIVVGGIATILGVVLLTGGEDTYVGLGGDASWRVGDVDPAWGWTLLLGGLFFVGAGVAVALGRNGRGAPARADSPRADLIAHSLLFVLVNAFVWTQDIALGDGVNYAWWITVPWGIGLLAHAVTYAVRDRA